MALRKGHCGTARERSFTRKSRLRGKNYIKAVPPSKISKFIMGDSKSYFDKKYEFVISLTSNQEIQLRDQALEATRQLLLRHLNEEVKNFCLMLKTQPHHIIREHKQAAVAQADRIFQGMSGAWGKPSLLAAQVKKNAKVFSIAVGKDKLKEAHEILAMAKAKLPGKYTIIEEKIDDLL
jgi:large subunit ribosomal protein L10e